MDNDRTIRRLAAVLALVLAGCGADATPAASDGGASDANHADAVTSDADADTTPVCRPAPAWKPGTPIFEEVTEAWKMTGVQGSRMNVLDVDGDGWADVLIRRGGGPQDFAKKQQDTWLLRNDGKGHFVDITASSALLQRRAAPDPTTGMSATAFCAGDVDNDGDLDVYLGRTRQANDGPEVETSEILLGDGKGHFELGPADNGARFAKGASVPLSAAFVDFDRDGNLDLWVVMNMASGANQPLQSRLLRGDGTGRFADVTKARGLQTKSWASVADLNAGKGHSWSWAATACDLNNDGREELLAASYGRAPNLLFRSDLDDQGAVHFTNISVASGYAYDHRQDWRDNWNAQCWCRDHPKDPECDTCPPPAADAICDMLKASFGPTYRWNHAGDRQPWRLGGNSGTTVCTDVDNDGWMDLLTTEIVHSDVGANSDPSELLFNSKDPNIKMLRPGNEVTGLERPDDSPYWNHGDITAAIYDFDNDGWQDVHIAESDYPGTYARLWRQKAPGKFQLLETADYFKRNRGAGVLAADFDRDGDLDVVTGHTQMRCDQGQGADCQPDDQVHLHRNLLGAERNWLQLDLWGSGGSNRMAIGAVAQVAAAGVTQMQAVDGGHGQASTQRDHVLHFGLDKACTAQVTVRWPDAAGTVETAQLAGNRRYKWLQGQAPQPLP
ncbi:MAG: CRTAC1 family protein [Deltaproteobacteria bacterium]|nr:CRTAC1 family protein [Deltaproteobacteria bacterium]